MKSHSTKRLVGNESDQAGYWSEVRTEWGSPTFMMPLKDRTSWLFHIWCIVRYIDISGDRNYSRYRVILPWAYIRSLQSHAMPFLLYPQIIHLQAPEYIITIGKVNTLLLRYNPFVFNRSRNCNQRFRSSLCPCLISSLSLSLTVFRDPQAY